MYNEIVVDNFCGGGGASTGISLAIGRSIDIAINHDPAAIAMHKVNHPDTRHYNESVWEVEPLKVANGRPVALVWLSPDCKHFSKAKGGKPVEKSVRGLAWVAVRWAATVKPRVIILENVEEFKTWGPLLKNGMPDTKQRGRTFNAFVNALKKQGYHVQHRELRACDYGAPTIRKRFFLVARCDGQPISWPKPTHGDPRSTDVIAGRLKPWRVAAEIIDWSIPCPSIFERKKPLASNTLSRIARGTQKFIINDTNPFIAPINFDANDHSGQVASFLISYHSETTAHEVRGLSLDGPIHTIDASNRFALVSAFVVQNYKTSVGQPLNNPLNSITTVNKASLVTAFLIKYYGSDLGQTLDGPLHTVTTKDRFGLVTIHGQDFQIMDIGMRMLKPHELFAAQGFPLDYIIDRDSEGKAYPLTEQTARCGNAVPPPFAEHLVRANLPELCDRNPMGIPQQLALFH